ncbi:MAG: RNA polymerase sigma factor [Proteobacteria bacterium]|nr:RNA polymerase sigma factor [Pseudomonadota bacterium]
MERADSIHSIYMSLRGSLARAVLGIVPPKEIEDIVQETYVRVCQVQSKEKIREPRSFLFKTARNLALDHVKRAESRLVVSVEDTGETGFGEAERSADETFDRVASNEEFSHFCEAVRQLPLQCRRAFVLKKVYGCSQREIARDMNLSESTVEKHIAQGIKRCTYFMMQCGEQDRGGKQAHKPGGAARLSAPCRGGRA